MCLSLIIISLFTSILPSQASINGAKIIGSVDYSGKGTIIDGTIAFGNEATASGSYLYVPVYKGKYEAGSFNYWWTKSWSGWSTNNNKKNPIIDFFLSLLPKGVCFALGQVLKRYGLQALLKSLGSYALYAQILLTFADASMQQMKKDSIDNFNNVLKSIDRDDKILLIQKTVYQNLISLDGSFPTTTMSLVAVDENIKYVSAKYDSRRTDKYGLYNYSNKRFYGEVSYIKSKSGITDLMRSYLNSFDILRWASYFPS